MVLDKILRRVRKDEPNEEPLEQAVKTRRSLLDRKERILSSFRETQETLGDRRRSNSGHRPERRGSGA